MTKGQKAVYGLIMLTTAAEEILDTLDDYGHQLSPIENSAADFASKVAQHMAERVGMDPAMIASAEVAGVNLAERTLQEEDITPESHQLPGKPDPTLN